MLNKTDKTFKLTVTDSKNATASQSITVRFYNGVYYGAIDYIWPCAD